MTEIREHVVAYCPQNDLHESLDGAIRAFRRDNGELRWTMRVPVAGAVASREVVSEVRPLAHKAGEATVELRFGPETSSMYPVFEGRLTASVLDPWNVKVEIEGTYEPPLGVLGAAFDATVGSRMARASIRRLLRDLADELETAGMFAQSAD